MLIQMWVLHFSYEFDNTGEALIKMKYRPNQLKHITLRLLILQQQQQQQRNELFEILPILFKYRIEKDNKLSICIEFVMYWILFWSWFSHKNLNIVSCGNQCICRSEWQNNLHLISQILFVSKMNRLEFGLSYAICMFNMKSVWKALSLEAWKFWFGS